MKIHNIMTEQENKFINNDREIRSEVFVRFLNQAKNIEAFQGKKIEEVFANEESKRKFINSLELDELIDLLNGTNGILRGKPKEKWEMDGERVGLESAFFGAEYLPPRPEDKKELLNNVLQAVKRMNSYNRDMKDLGLLTSASINSLHLYLDANGRTSRLAYLLLTEKYKDLVNNKLLEKVLGEYGREEVDINPYFIQVEIEDLIEKELGIKDDKVNDKNIMGLWSEDPKIHYKWSELEFNENIDKKQANLVGQLLEKDYINMFYSFFKYYKEHSSQMDEYLKVFPQRTRILVDKFVKGIKPKELNEIINNYREFKKDFVNKLIDVIENSDKEEYQIENGNQKISIKDYFEKRIKEEREKWEEMGA